MQYCSLADRVQQVKLTRATVQRLTKTSVKNVRHSTLCHGQQKRDNVLEACPRPRRQLENKKRGLGLDAVASNFEVAELVSNTY